MAKIGIEFYTFKHPTYDLHILTSVEDTWLGEDNFLMDEHRLRFSTANPCGHRGASRNAHTTVQIKWAIRTKESS